MNILCKLGFHKKKYCEAVYKLLGQWGVIRTYVCERCGYKNPKGIFIPSTDEDLEPL